MLTVEITEVRAFTPLPEPNGKYCAPPPEPLFVHCACAADEASTPAISAKPLPAHWQRPASYTRAWQPTHCERTCMRGIFPLNPKSQLISIQSTDRFPWPRLHLAKPEAAKTNQLSRSNDRFNTFKHGSDRKKLTSGCEQ